MEDDTDIVSSLHTTDMYHNVEELRIILLGKTGTGKSSLGNLIYGCKGFETGFGACPITKECCLKERVFGGRKIKIIDTPGLFDPLARQQDNHTAISQSLQSSHPGPHAFLVVFQPGRMVKEERACVQTIKDIFGPTALNYCIFILTHGDEMVRQNMTFEQYLDTDPFLKNDLLPQFKNRWMVIDNTIPLTDERNRQVVKDLVRMILDLVAINNYTFLQNGLIEKVSEIIRRQEAFGKFNLAELDGSIIVIPEIMDEVITYNYGDERLNTISSSHTSNAVDAIPDTTDEVVTYEYGDERLNIIPSSDTSNTVGAIPDTIDEVVTYDYGEERLNIISSSDTSNTVGAIPDTIGEVVTGDYGDERHNTSSSSTNNTATL